MFVVLITYEYKTYFISAPEECKKCVLSNEWHLQAKSSSMPSRVDDDGFDFDDKSLFRIKSNSPPPSNLLPPHWSIPSPLPPNPPPHWSIPSPPPPNPPPPHWSIPLHHSLQHDLDLDLFSLHPVNLLIPWPLSRFRLLLHMCP